MTVVVDEICTAGRCTLRAVLAGLLGSLLSIPPVAHAGPAGAAAAGLANAASVALADAAANAAPVTPVTSCIPAGVRQTLVHADDFRHGLSQWVAEFKPARSSVAVGEGRLTVDVAGGATVWFKPVLSGDYVVRYRRKVVMDGGPNDRLSDLNQFWMARDPASADLYTRDGTFEQYDGLRLYYAGIGGNGNTTTRLRRYDGGRRVLLSDLGDARHLLRANHVYLVEVAVYHGCTHVALDGETVFSYRDPQPFTSGQFGFRTTQSRQEISDFQVVQLD